MGLGVPPGAIQNQGSVLSQQTTVAQKDVQSLANQLQDVQMDLMNLTEELSQGQSSAGKKVGKEGQESSSAQAAAKKPGEHKADVNAEAVAISALSQEEEEELKFKRENQTFKKKMAQMGVLTGLLEGLRLDDPEQQAVLEEFLKTCKQFKQWQNRLTGLEEKEAKLKQILADQDTKNKKEEKQEGERQKQVKPPEKTGPIPITYIDPEDIVQKQGV